MEPAYADCNGSKIFVADCVPITFGVGNTQQRMIACRWRGAVSPNVNSFSVGFGAVPGAVSHFREAVHGAASHFREAPLLW